MSPYLYLPAEEDGQPVAGRNGSKEWKEEGS